MKTNKTRKRTLLWKEKPEEGQERKSKLTGADFKAKKDREQFPGYPQYPPKDDIMNPKNGNAKNEFTETSGKLVKPASPKAMKELPADAMERRQLQKSEAEADETTSADTEITNEELKLIGSDELSSDMGDDEELKKRTWDVDMAGEDLDVPGTEPDSENEDIGQEDEENNLYSIGGDRHEDLDEDKDLGR